MCMVNRKALCHDFHIHTSLSECCADKDNMVPWKIIDRAHDLGFLSIGFSDHYWRDGFKMIRRLQNEMRKATPKLQVLIGCEADVLAEDTITISRKDINSLELDFVILATNHFHLDSVWKPDDLSPRKAADHWLKFLRIGIQSGIADIIPHPVLNLHNALGDINRVMDTVEDEEIIEVLEMAKANNVAMDVNPRLFTNPLWKPEIQIRFYKLCKKVGVKIAPASDAHAIDEIGDTFKLKPWLDEAGFVDEDIIDHTWFNSCRRRNNG